VNGWTALSVVRWFLVLGGVAGVALLLAQARLRAPAVPVTLTVLTSLLALICLIAMIVRVLDPPDSLDLRAGALIGLAATAALLIGAVQSMRVEGILDRDGPGEIPTLSI
jgi:membrane protein implicated in regulation of membrane protease activity